jgi:hypothetical protein
MKKKYVFFMKKKENEWAELARIKKILMSKGHEVCVPKSTMKIHHSAQFGEVLESGKIPVLIGLNIYEKLPPEAVEIVSRFGKLPMLTQVLNLLGIEPNRKDALISANAKGDVSDLQEIGATKKEIAWFLGLDSSNNMSVRDMLLEVENVPPEISAKAEKAVAEKTHIGDLIIVNCSNAKATKAVARRLFGEQEERNFLILSEEYGFSRYYGPSETVLRVHKSCPGGIVGGLGLMPYTQEAEIFWGKWGGKPPKTAYWKGFAYFVGQDRLLLACLHPDKIDIIYP